MADDLVPWHEAIRIRPVIRPARKLNRPVGRDQAETIPPVSPRLTNLTPLNHHMLNTTSTQLMTDRQTSLAAPHDDRIRRLLHHGPQPYTPRRPIRARPQLGAGEREASSEPGLEPGASWPRRAG